MNESTALANIPLPAIITALVATLDNCTPAELGAAKRALTEFKNDYGNAATRRRIALALRAALDEVR